jgi:copper chaperone CopZ
MKAIQLSFLAVFGLVAVSLAQTKALEKAVIKTPTVQCDMCKETIEARLGHEYGVMSVAVNVRRKTTTVSWLTDRTNLETIKDAIAVIGYDADDVPADEISYKKLPKCCKKPEPKKPVVAATPVKN